MDFEWKLRGGGEFLYKFLSMRGREGRVNLYIYFYSFLKLGGADPSRQVIIFEFPTQTVLFQRRRRRCCRLVNERYLCGRLLNIHFLYFYLWIVQGW